MLIRRDAVCQGTAACLPFTTTETTGVMCTTACATPHMQASRHGRSLQSAQPVLGARQRPGLGHHAPGQEREQQDEHERDQPRRQQLVAQHAGRGAHQHRGREHQRQAVVDQRPRRVARVALEQVVQRARQAAACVAAASIRPPRWVAVEAIKALTFLPSGENGGLWAWLHALRGNWHGSARSGATAAHQSPRQRTGQPPPSRQSRAGR